MALLRALATASCLLAGLAVTPQAFAKDGADAYQKLILGRHYKKAVVLLAKSAKAGNPLSQYRLAVMLRSGLGTKRDDAKARDWLRKSAAGGNAEAGKLLQSLSTIITTEAVPVPVATPFRSARVAVLAKLKPHPSGKQDWLTISAARAFEEVETGSTPTNLDARDATGQTPLMAAVRSGNLKLVERFLALQANVNLSDQRGMSAYLWALETGNIALAKILVGGAANVDQRTAEGNTADLLAARRCSIETLEEAQAHFRQSRSNYAGETAAHALARSCVDVEIPENLVSQDDAITADSAGRTPLWRAVANGNRQLATILLERDAALTTSDNEGFTPLHIAASTGNAVVVDALLQKQVEAEALDKHQNTPLMLAAAKGRLETVKQLLPLANDINQKNIDGDTVLTLAVRSGRADIAALVVAAGGSTTSRTISRDTPEKIAERLGSQAMLEALK